MRSLITRLFFLSICISSQVLGEAKTLNFVTQLEAGNKQKVVAYGTSLTKGGEWVRYLDSHLNSKYPGLVTVVNRGAGGREGDWGVANLQNLVIKESPDAVFIEFCMTEADDGTAERIQRSRDNLEIIIDGILKDNPKCDIIVQTMNPQTKGGFNKYLPLYYQGYRNVATEKNVILIDHYHHWLELMENDRKTFDKYVKDGTHPHKYNADQFILPEITRRIYEPIHKFPMRHAHTTKFQNGERETRVQLPLDYDLTKEYPVLYVLSNESEWDEEKGCALEEITNLGIPDDRQIILVQVEIENSPWYGDHPSESSIRQEALILEHVVPFIDSKYSTQDNPEGRFLLGMAQSGWGAVSLLMRNPEVFGYAAAWDSPLMEETMSDDAKKVFDTQQQFDKYRPDLLVTGLDQDFKNSVRLVIAGNNAGGEDQTEAYHHVLTALSVPHVYNGTLDAAQEWHEDWLAPVLESLLNLPNTVPGEPTNAAEAAEKRVSESERIERLYQAKKATLSPERLAWEILLEENLGNDFYLPIHKRDFVNGVSTGWDFVADNPNLPRVLLIGDSISRGYTLPTRKILAGKANVHRAPENCRNTANGLQKLDMWLGTKKWDIIHFNFGIHDRRTPIPEYINRLTQIVNRLEATGATLIWATTTPVPYDPKKERTDTSIVERNAAAAVLMKKHSIAINDLYTAIKPHLATLQKPKQDVHFKAAGNEFLANRVAEAIQSKILAESRR